MKTTAKDKIFLFLGSAFGLGLMPVAPGSFGALLGVAMHIGVARWVAPPCQVWALLACLAGVSAVHFALTPWAQRYWDDTDPGHFVLDEVAGYLVVPIALGWSVWPSWYVAPLGFFVFRVFDIIKLPGARHIDRNWHGAWGVLLDDIVSGLYAAVAVGLVLWVWTGRAIGGV